MLISLRSQGQQDRLPVGGQKSLEDFTSPRSASVLKGFFRRVYCVLGALDSLQDVKLPKKRQTSWHSLGKCGYAFDGVFQGRMVRGGERNVPENTS